jgi:hypothetical protein
VSPFCACPGNGKAPKVGRMKWQLLILAAASLVAGPALAQRNGNYPVKEMNFDLWCQEQAALPVERCDKRTAQDEAAFEAYRSKVEAYEIPYLQQKNNAARLDQDILRNDPVDNPAVKDLPSQRPDLNTPSTTTPPRP